MKKAIVAAIWILVCTCLLSAQSTHPGRNHMMLRGHAQDLYLYPTQGSERGTVLFLPGDGGWRGFAIDMARSLAASGYSTYGWDIKQYLMGFTNGNQTLSQAEMAADIGQVAEWVMRGKPGRLILAGWSEGAAMAVLAASVPANQSRLAGVMTVGLPEAAVLGWRRVDDLTYVTKRMPNEPTFPLAPLMPRISPLPLAVIQSTMDEYVPGESAQRLLEAAREPKRFFLIQARSHRYEGNQAELFRTLQESAAWILRGGR
jgi:dienelactone hydrolase